jgi:hypothetical protein
MYRACSTWQYEVIAHLIEKHWNGVRLGYLTGEKFSAFDDVWADRACWSVLKSHEGDQRYAARIADGRALAVYAYRDIRDVVFSLMHKRRVSFETLFRQGMIHQILVNDRFWRAQPGVLCQRYEELIADPVAAVEQIAAHLGLALGPGEAVAVAAEYSFQANQRRTETMGLRLRAEGVDLDDPTNVQYYDSRTLLHWNHMREGRPGNWRELATPRQRAILARLCDRWLAENGYQTDSREPAGVPKSSRLIARTTESTGQEFALAKAALACSLRCMALRYPRVARAVKRSLGMEVDYTVARPFGPTGPATEQTRIDPTAPEVPVRPHLLGSSPAEGRDDGVGVVDATSPGAAANSLERGPQARVGR